MEKNELKVWFKDASWDSDLRYLEGLKIKWRDDSGADYKCWGTRKGDENSNKHGNAVDDIENEYPIVRMKFWYSDQSLMTTPTLYLSNGESFQFNHIDNDDRDSDFEHHYDWSAAPG